MLWMLIVTLALVAGLYSTVGHGGASGYIAVMVLFGYSQDLIRQDALILNLLVSAIAFIQFYRGGFFQWKLFLPLVIGSVPMAFWGGTMELHANWYKVVLGALLLVPALVFLVNRNKKETALRELPVWAALIIGAALGLVSGLTGIGGGVLLSPILVFGKWAGQKTTAAISAPFILVNSAAGLLGMSTHSQSLDTNLCYFAAATVIGGLAGATLGAGKFSNAVLKRILGMVLLIAALKLLFT